MADEIKYQNVVRVIRDGRRWHALIGPDPQLGLLGTGPSPRRALLDLSGRMVDSGWVLDESYRPAPDLPRSPNVIELLKGERGLFAEWTARSASRRWGRRAIDVFTHWRPAQALACWALGLPRDYGFEPNFRGLAPQPPVVGPPTPVPDHRGDRHA